jgi:hypothetical protein
MSSNWSWLWIRKALSKRSKKQKPKRRIPRKSVSPEFIERPEKGNNQEGSCTFSTKRILRSMTLRKREKSESRYNLRPRKNEKQNLEFHKYETILATKTVPYAPLLDSLHEIFTDESERGPVHCLTVNMTSFDSPEGRHVVKLNFTIG